MSDFKTIVEKWIGRLKHAVAFGTMGVAFMTIMALPMRADFIGYYAVGNFTVDNTNADGSASTPDSGVTGVFTGGNNGSALPGSTTFLITAPAAGTVMFSYLYQSLDIPMQDMAGYLLNGVLTQLGDTDGESGAISFPVVPGDIFGFEIDTADNIGEPGILNVSDFQAPTAVPEPNSGLLISLVIAGYVARRLHRGHGKHAGGTS